MAQQLWALGRASHQHENRQIGRRQEQEEIVRQRKAQGARQQPAWRPLLARARDHSAMDSGIAKGEPDDDVYRQGKGLNKEAAERRSIIHNSNSSPHGVGRREDNVQLSQWSNTNQIAGSR